MKKCDCKIMNTLSRYPKVWPWLGVAGYALDGAELVLQLGKAKRDGTLETMLRDIGRADLIILDEFGYVPFDIDGARLLYQIIAGSYERRSIIFTTNIEFSKWGTVFADDKLAAAIIDRIVHHGRLLEFTGQSRRVSEALMFGRNTSAQPEK